MKISITGIFPTTPAFQSHLCCVIEQCTLKIPLHTDASSSHPIRARGAATAFDMSQEFGRCHQPFCVWHDRTNLL